MEAYDETDAFKCSENELPLMFKNYHNDLLIAHPEESIAKFQSVNAADDETDAFKCSENELPLMFKNYHNDLLIAHPEESIAKFQSVNAADDNMEQAKFFLHTYRELAIHQNGLPVAISCKIGKKKYIMCATSDFTITMKECELPKEIPSKTSEFIFYQKVFSTEQTSFRFESSLNEDFYLAYSTEHPVKKLFLKHCPEGEIDETIKMILEEPYSMPAVL